MGDICYVSGFVQNIPNPIIVIKQLFPFFWTPACRDSLITAIHLFRRLQPTAPPFGLHRLPLETREGMVQAWGLLHNEGVLYSAEN